MRNRVHVPHVNRICTRLVASGTSTRGRVPVIRLEDWRHLGSVVRTYSLPNRSSSVDAWMRVNGYPLPNVDWMLFRATPFDLRPVCCTVWT